MGEGEAIKPKTKVQTAPALKKPGFFFFKIKRECHAKQYVPVT
jgi:hypothetical protein